MFGGSGSRSPRVTLIVVVTGTLVTASGPHAGDADVVDRLGRIEPAIRVHVRATAVFGIALLALVWHLRRAPLAPAVSPAPARARAAQAIVGELQWRTELPWWLVLVHVALAAGIWAATVWLVDALLAANRLAPPERRLRQWRSFASRRGRSCGSRS